MIEEYLEQTDEDVKKWRQAIRNLGFCYYIKKKCKNKYNCNDCKIIRNK